MVPLSPLHTQSEDPCSVGQATRQLIPVGLHLFCANTPQRGGEGRGVGERGRSHFNSPACLGNQRPTMGTSHVGDTCIETLFQYTCSSNEILFLERFLLYFLYEQMKEVCCVHC